MRYNAEYNPVDELFGKKNENITTESNQNTNDIKENIELPDNNKTIINDYDQTNYEQNMNIDNNDNNFNYGIDNNENKKFNKHKLLLLLGLILFIVIVIVITIFIIKIREQKEEIKKEVAVLTDSIDVKAVGFQFDEPFDKNKFEYNLEIDTKKVQIKCSRYERVEGCNQVIDLSDKDSYDHIIKYSTLDDKEYTYIIHINKKEMSGPIKIASLEINETKYTNDENKILVNAESENNKKLQYSFDGGNTWQNSNQYETKENEEVNIVIKDEDGNKTENKVVEIDNIDKIAPTVDIIIKEKTTNKIVLQANAKDEASGIDLYNWNNSGYIKASTYEVTKAGTYTVVVKDKAGNISSKASITVPDSEFNKEAQKESKTYTVKLVGNGASIEKNQLTCSTYELSCTVKLPNITRENGIIIGFAESANATTAKYNVGEEITLTGNKTLYAITSKKVTATFEKNGASTLSYTSKSCNIYNTNTTCTIKSPAITRDGWTIVGFAESANATTAEYKASSNISISENKKYYAITNKKVTATFEKNGASTLSYTSKSCNIYNTNTTCTIKSPAITRSGWTILGFAESAAATTEKYKVSSNITIGENKKYYAITNKTLKAAFNGNGANVASTSETCSIYNTNTSCKVNAPTITRNGWEILGYSTNKNATSGSKDKTLSADKTYYAITKKTITVKFEKNDQSNINYTKFDYIEYSSKTCDIYNNASSCKIKIPFVDVKGLMSFGFNKGKTRADYEAPADYKTGNTYNFNESTTLYASFENLSYYRNIMGNVTERFQYKNSTGVVIVDVEKGCNATEYKNYFDEIYNNSDWKFLLNGNSKIMILTKNTMKTAHLNIGNENNVINGSTYGESNKHINVSFNCEQANFFTVIHELSHRWDYRYQDKYGTNLRSKFSDLYDKYRSSSSKPLRNYAFTNLSEFFAVVADEYYMNYVDNNKHTIPSDRSKGKYTSDLKTLFEKTLSQCKI